MQTSSQLRLKPSPGGADVAACIIVFSRFEEEVPVPYNFTLAAIIPASPQEIYDAWLDSVAHSAMTRSEASIGSLGSGEWGHRAPAHGDLRLPD